MSVGCVGMIEGDEPDSLEHRRSGTRSGKWQGEGRFNHDILIVTLGASISAGYTFDASLVGVEGVEPVYSQNHHIPRLEGLLEDVTGLRAKLKSYAVPGATSGEILADQVPRAIEVISAYLASDNPPQVIITVEAGGNDLRDFQAEYVFTGICSQPDPTPCLQGLGATLQEMGNNVGTILGTLRGYFPDAKIVIQTQYNPLYGNNPLGEPCAPPEIIQLADVAFENNPALEGHLPYFPGMNPIIRDLAATFGADVADVGGYLYMQGNPAAAFGADCTHPAGVQDGIPGLLAPDAVGLGAEVHFAVFANALL